MICDTSTAGSGRDTHKISAGCGAYVGFLFRYFPYPILNSVPVRLQVSAHRELGSHPSIGSSQDLLPFSSKLGE